MNKVILIGRLGDSVELAYTANQTPIAKFRIATSEHYLKDGEKKTSTEWHSIKVIGKMGEICNTFLAKGSQCMVEGKLRTDSWDDKKTGEKKYKTEIVVMGPGTSVQFLDSKKQEEEESRPVAKKTPPKKEEAKSYSTEDLDW